MRWISGIALALALAAQLRAQAVFDLAFDRGRMAKSMFYENWSGTCGFTNNPTPFAVGPHMIKFNAYQANLGPGDFYTSNPSNDLFQAKVFDMAGNLLTTSQKDQFCPTDNGGQTSFVTYGLPASHSCDGITPGWMDVYNGGYDCNGANFGTLGTGDYSIWVDMNPSHSHEANSPNGSEKDWDNQKVWVTGRYNFATSFVVKTSMSISPPALAAGKKLYYGVHKMNNTGTGIITINAGADITQTAGASELGLYAHKVQLTNQSGNQSLIQVAAGSKLNIRVLGPEQY